MIFSSKPSQSLSDKDIVSTFTFSPGVVEAVMGGSSGGLNEVTVGSPDKRPREEAIKPPSRKSSKLAKSKSCVFKGDPKWRATLTDVNERAPWTGSRAASAPELSRLNSASNTSLGLDLEAMQSGDDQDVFGFFDSFEEPEGFGCIGKDVPSQLDNDIGLSISPLLFGEEEVKAIPPEHDEKLYEASRDMIKALKGYQMDTYAGISEVAGGAFEGLVAPDKLEKTLGLVKSEYKVPFDSRVLRRQREDQFVADFHRCSDLLNAHLETAFNELRGAGAFGSDSKDGDSKKLIRDYMWGLSQATNNLVGPGLSSWYQKLKSVSRIWGEALPSFNTVSDDGRPSESLLRPRGIKTSARGQLIARESMPDLNSGSPGKRVQFILSAPKPDFNAAQLTKELKVSVNSRYDDLIGQAPRFEVVDGTSYLHYQQFQRILGGMMSVVEHLMAAWKYSVEAMLSVCEAASNPNELDENELNADLTRVWKRWSTAVEASVRANVVRGNVNEELHSLSNYCTREYRAALAQEGSGKVLPANRNSAFWDGRVRELERVGEMFGGNRYFFPYALNRDAD